MAGFGKKNNNNMGGNELINNNATLNEILNLTKSNYTQISNKILLNENLSLGAKGLLCLMLSRPDGWQFYNWELAKKSKDTEYAVKQFLKELTQAKYLHRFRKANKGKGKGFRWIWIFKDEPLTDEEIEKVENYYNPSKMGISNYQSDSTISLNNYDSSIERYSNTKSFSNTECFSNTKNNHDKTLDVFENLFKEFGINYTNTNQASVKKLLKTMSEKEVIKYLTDTYNALKENKNIKSIARAFSAKIQKGERQINSKPKAEKTNVPIILEKEKETKVTEVQEIKPIVASKKALGEKDLPSKDFLTLIKESISKELKKRTESITQFINLNTVLYNKKTFDEVKEFADSFNIKV